MKIFLTGGTGYVGSVLARQLSEEGHGVRALTRRPDRAAPPPPGVSLVGGDILRRDSLAEPLRGVDAAIHLVGIIFERRGAGFEAIHAEGTRNVVDAAKGAGVRRYLHMSALGARPDARARYHKSKWAAEECVRASGLEWTIFRPSIIFGERDEFINVFARMVRLSPLLPVLGPGDGKLQPIWVEDVCRCFVRALGRPETAGKAYELGGREAFPLNQLLDLIASSLGKRRAKVHLPLDIARVPAAVFEAILPKPPFNRDQLIMLQEDNVCDPAPMERDFGFTPRDLRDYLRERFGGAGAGAR